VTGAPAPLPFLPGPMPDRETWEGWTRWRLARGAFEPAPRVSAAEHARMGRRQQRLHDLHRTATHANLKILDTPMSRSVTQAMLPLVDNNALYHGPDTRPGLMISGGACQGKTETVCEALACWEEEWRAMYGEDPGAAAGTLDQHVPVAYVRTPVLATPISACQRILHFFGEDYKGMGLEALLRTVKDAVYDHPTKALVIDDITRLKMHRERDQDVLDLIRELMSLPLTLVLVGAGIAKSGLLRDGRRDPETGQWLIPPVRDRGRSRNDDAPGQTDLRFDPVNLNRFLYSTQAHKDAWADHLAGVEEQLRLLRARDGMLSDPDMAGHLFDRTRGIVGLLRKLIQMACSRAMETGCEEITIDLLDTLVIRKEDLPGLDPGSGEVPDIPRCPAASPEGPATRSSTTGASPPARQRAERCPARPGPWAGA